VNATLTHHHFIRTGLFRYGYFLIETGHAASILSDERRARPGERMVTIHHFRPRRYAF
jgi:hypothetical protein